MYDGYDTKDFSVYHPVGEGGARLNDVIAFKMLEMSDSNTPELSEFKEGRVTDIQEETITFHILNRKRR